MDPNYNFNKEQFTTTSYYESNSPEAEEFIDEHTKKLIVQDLALRYHVDEKSLLRKLDFYVILPFMFVTFVSFLCRSNLGVLQIEGIYNDLEIGELQFFAAYSAFFAPYVLFQFVSNIILKRVRPHFWISFSVLVYGASILGTAYVKNYSQFVACQFLHGLFQSGVETAMWYIIAQYYAKKEAQKRFGAIYSVQCLAGAVSTSIAFSIDRTLANKFGISSWRWLLIVEGAMAMFVGIILFFSVPDFPENARFIDEDETNFLVGKLETYQGRSGFDLEISNTEYFSMIIDPLVLLPALASLGISYATYAYAFFEPIFMFQITGTSIADTNKKSVYPWICAFVYCNITSYISDLTQRRSYFMLFNILLTISGGAMAFAGHLQVPDHVKYAGCFLMACGGFTSVPLLMCWTAGNLGGHTRKNLGLTMSVSFGSLSGLIVPYPFFGTDLTYMAGFSTGFAFLLFGLICAMIYLFKLKSANKEKRTDDYKYAFSMESQRKQIILGDKSPAFTYMY